MRKMIEVSKIDGLLEKYKAMECERKSFSEFIESSGFVREDGVKISDWAWVDSVGIVQFSDFENEYTKEFIEERFEDLAHAWFGSLNVSVDFDIVLENVKEEVQEIFTCEKCGKQDELTEWGLEDPEDDTCEGCQKIRAKRKEFEEWAK